MTNKRLLILFLTGLLFISYGLYQKDQHSKTIHSPKTSVSISITPTPTQNASSITEQAAVKRVIDGDTIELADGRRLRYIGIDAPEIHDPRQAVQCFGEEAYEANKALVEGKVIQMKKDVSEKDRYGRLLRFVYLDSSKGLGQFVNDYLVRQGFAKASTYPPDVTYQKQFQEAEQEARINNRGLWSNCQ